MSTSDFGGDIGQINYEYKPFKEININQIFDKIQMILMMKTSISNNHLLRLKKIRSHGFKTDSILRQIIKDVITDVYEIPFKEFGKTGQ